MTQKVTPLPARYQDWTAPFRGAVEQRLTDGCAILDIGAGRRPCFSRSTLPPNARYVGLDVSESELRAAPAGSYDETVVGDVATRNADLEGRFDVAMSWQVLEHVRPLDEAFENVRSYLRPAGHFVAHLSGTFSMFGLLNRALPHGVSTRAMSLLLKRDPRSVFPAYYDKCWYSALVKVGRPWSRFEVQPRFAGATYFAFSPAAQRLYLRYEDWARQGGHRNLATHYLVTAER